MEMFSQSLKKNRALTYFWRATIGIVGFILSPLSWWNDLFVNIPLAYGFAWVLGKSLNTFIVVHRWLFINLFVGGYFLSNLLGFLMIHYSIFGLKKAADGPLKKQVLVSLAYSIIIVAFFGTGLCDPAQGCEILPDWVEP